MKAEDLKKVAESKYIKAMIDYLESKDREAEMHITHYVYPCLRRGYWDWKNSTVGVDKNNYDEKSLLTFVIGQKMHEIAISDRHEYKMRYRGVIGTSDDIIVSGDKVIIVDKKTSIGYGMPKDEAKEHHTLQVQYYAVLYEYGEREENGKWVENIAKSERGKRKYYGVVLYIDVENKVLNGMPFEIDVKKAKAELDEKIDIMVRADKLGKPPNSVYGWWCKYCQFYRPCRELDATENV